MSDIVERLQDVAAIIQKEHGRVAGASCLTTEAAYLITSLRAELERKDAALRAIGEGDVPRPIGTHFRGDKMPSKNDQCIHGLWMYEECGQCIEDFARAALSAQKEEEA